MLTQFYFNLYNYMYNLLHREEGQDLAEYAILLGIVALLVVGVILALGTQISRIFSLALSNLTEVK